VKAYQDFLAGPAAVFPALPTALPDVRAQQATFADGRVVVDRGEIPEPLMPAVVTEGMAQPPVGLPAIGRAALKALRTTLRPVRAPEGRPQLEVPAQDAQWFVLGQLDSATVGTADGRGVTFRRRDPAAFWRLAKQSVRLNLEVARRFPAASAEYRGAYGELTSAENWAGVFKG
jgi:galactofuranosylgalactofuranosylrhamnosyl-N-acetylglucosaminyl-diphospho-decaprenol beta-1,5/1,6-galactofuranosyltransferase